jgi:hypothetical protein
MTLPAGMRLLERFAITAPLGVRFWDVATNEAVTSGLTMEGILVDDPHRVVRAFANPSGVMVVRDLPGFRGLENSDGSDAAWRDAPPPIQLTLTVRDEATRFQPFTFVCDAPQKGFARLGCPVLSPPDSRSVPAAPDDSVPVFPAPARRVPAGLAVVRAQLAEPPDTGSPPRDRVYGAWAFVEALVDDRPSPVGASYADENGRVAIMFPWPVPADASSLLSPPSPLPASGAGGLLKQRWRVRLRAYYDGLAPDQLPDLCRVLAQRPAQVWDDSALFQPLDARELAYGSELVVKSRDRAGAPGRELPELLITAGT